MSGQTIHQTIRQAVRQNTTDLTPEMAQELEKLRDIHLPEPVSWFPMAIGWWMLLTIALVIIGWLTYKLWNKRYRRYRVDKDPVYLAAIQELQQLNIALMSGSDVKHIPQLAGQLSTLLKRVGLYHKLPIATLSGAPWSAYLQQTGFDACQANLIAFGAYSDDVIGVLDMNTFDWQALETQVQAWITEQFIDANQASKSSDQQIITNSAPSPNERGKVNNGERL